MRSPPATSCTSRPSYPHQLLIPAGKEFTYFVIKIDTP